MFFSRFGVIGASLLALCIAQGANAQGLITQKVLSADMALELAMASLEDCRAKGFSVSITVVNVDGLIKAFVRDDKAGPHTIGLSQKKAFTAASQKNHSGAVAIQWGDRAPPAIDGIVALAGGVPIRAGGEVIGAVGISGAPAGDPAGTNDEICANAGIASIADRLD